MDAASTARTVRTLLLGLALAGGCKEAPAASRRDPAQPPSPAARPAPTLADLRAEARTGRLGVGIRAALVHPDPSTRHEAVRLLSWVAPSEARPFVLRSLGDPDPRVRAEAGFVLSLLPDLGDEGEERLLGALAAEGDPAARASWVRSLGRVASERGLSALRVALQQGTADEKRAACRALADAGERGEPIDVAVHQDLAQLLRPDVGADVRTEAALALASLPPAPLGDTARGLRQALIGATSDAEPAVRAAAFAALGRLGGCPLETLAPGLEDPELAVANEAMRVLVGTVDAAHDALVARTLDGALARMAPEDPVSRTRLGRLVDLAAPLAAQPKTFAAAEALHAQLGALASPTPELGRLHCRAAELVDRGRGWPSRLETCGLGQVPIGWRLERTAVLLGDLRGEEALRLTSLVRLFETGTPRVAAAALRALPPLEVPGAVALLVQGLGTDEPGIRIPALQVYAARRERAAPSDPWIATADPAALSAIAAAVELDLPEARLAAVRAAAVCGIPDATALLVRLAQAPERGVREAVRSTLARSGRPVAPASGLALPRGSDAPPAEPTNIIFDTDAGTFEVRLDSPSSTAASRLVEAIRRGAYAGRSVDRVQVGRAVTFGGPRSDAYGTDLPLVPSEPDAEPTRRGDLLLAEVGADTGSTRLLVRLADAPALDGRVTRVGRVTRGLDVVERLDELDRIRGARTSVVGR